jgi:hypothetical protein
MIKKIWSDPYSDDRSWYLGPYFIMCCVMTAAVLLYPLATSFIGVLLLRILLTAILLSALYAISRSPQLFRVMLVLLVPILLANWTVHPADHPQLSLFMSAAILLVMLVAVGVIFKDVITARRISADIIFGSIAIYLLMGVLWALAYALLNDITPGMVIESVGKVATVQQRAELLPEFTYFSFITLTSVGYGDLTPIGNAARALAIVEGVFGQLYTAILIGKLVGMKVAQE